MRIAKLLANYNQGSRREIERLITNKKIFLNKKIVSSPVTFVDIKDEIIVNNKKVIFLKKTEILKFYKPKNIIFQSSLLIILFVQKKNRMKEK